jgi:hypothetical protein
MSAAGEKPVEELPGGYRGCASAPRMAGRGWIAAVQSWPAAIAFRSPAEWRVLANNWMMPDVHFLVVAEEQFMTATG